MTAPGTRVAVAGCGTAAATLACLLRGSGVDVVLLASGRRTPAAGPGIEALPEATVRLLADAGLAGALAAAGAVTVQGFENASGPGVHRLDGWWTHVDRARLAAECVHAARRLGATVLPADAGGAPVPVPGGLEVRGGGDGRLCVAAAVDATGRAARWSRPVVRAGHDSATLYAGPGTATARPGRMTRIRDGWAYRLDHPDATVVGVIGAAGARPSTLEELIATGLEVAAPERFVRLAVRPAAVQWSRDPVRSRRLAVGDAALAMSPISGQGLRFAVSSAFAAAHVLRSWLHDGGRGESDDDASGYYRAFVDGVRLRHLAKVGGPEPAPDVVAHTVPDLTGRLRWTAPTTEAGLPVAGRIVSGECCVLPDGGLVRYVGGVDLLTVRAAVGDGLSSAALHDRLVASGVEPTSARTLVAWAVRTGVLAGPPRPENVTRR